MNKTVRELSEAEFLSNLSDGRIAAIRFDLIDWSVVLDIDGYFEEAEDRELFRVWLVFQDLISIDAQFLDLGIPNGLFFNGLPRKVETGEKFITLQIPFSARSGAMTISSWITICSRTVRCFSSIKSEKPNDYNTLANQIRTSLVSDLELLDAYENSPLG